MHHRVIPPSSDMPDFSPRGSAARKTHISRQKTRPPLLRGACAPERNAERVACEREDTIIVVVSVGGRSFVSGAEENRRESAVATNRERLCDTRKAHGRKRQEHIQRAPLPLLHPQTRAFSLPPCRCQPSPSLSLSLNLPSRRAFAVRAAREERGRSAEFSAEARRHREASPVSKPSTRTRSPFRRCATCHLLDSKKGVARVGRIGSSRASSSRLAGRLASAPARGIDWSRRGVRANPPSTRRCS